MKFKIEAGAQIEVPSKKEISDEMRGVLTSWFAEVAQGGKFRRFSAYGDADGSGVVTIGASGDQRIGPSEGFIWSVKRLTVAAGYDDTGALGLYIGSTDSSALVHPDIALYNSFDQNQLVLYPGDTLVLSGAATASARVWITGQVQEFPISLAWRL